MMKTFQLLFIVCVLQLLSVGHGFVTTGPSLKAQTAFKTENSLSTEKRSMSKNIAPRALRLNMVGVVDCSGSACVFEDEITGQWTIVDFYAGTWHLKNFIMNRPGGGMYVNSLRMCVL